MEKLEKATITLPKEAFRDSPPAQVSVKIGDTPDKLHHLILTTRAFYTDSNPRHKAPSMIFHFSTLSCLNPLFKRTQIITVVVKKGVIAEILRRFPFELREETK